MVESSFGDAAEQNSRISAYKESIDQQVRALLKDGSSLKQIATALGAEAFYDTIERSRSGNPVDHFSVKGFVDHQISSGKFLRLPQRITETNEVILPSDSNEIITGSGTGMEQKKMVPRNQAIMELLSNLGLEYEIVDGVNSPNMFRKSVYRIYSVDKLAKLVFVNDEEDNATYIIHAEKGESWQNFARLTKNQLQELPTDRYRKIRYPSDIEKWKADLEASLTEQRFPLIEQEEPSDGEKKEYSLAPVGWYTRTTLADKLGTAHSVIKRISDIYKGDEEKRYNHWFHDYYNESSRTPREYLHPDLVAIISADLNSREFPPQGWVNNHSLTTKWNVANETIKKLSRELSKDNPEWIKPYKDLTKKMVDHFHPDLVAKINEELRLKEKAPKGWMNRWSLSEKLGIAFTTVERLAKPFKETHKEWFKEYFDPMNKLVEYFHPDLVSFIEKSVEQREYAPKGWMNRKEIAKKFDITFDLVTSMLAEYKEKEYQHWFKEYHAKGRTKREFIHPDLINILEQKIKLMEYAPADWMSKGEIYDKYGIGLKPIKRIVDSYKKQPGQTWVKNYYNKKNQMTEYVHPDLIQIIRDRKKDRQIRN